MLVNRFTPSCHDNPTSKRRLAQRKCSRQYTRLSPPKAFALGCQFVVLALKPTRDIFEQNHSLALRGVQISLKGISCITDLFFKADVACICSGHLIFPLMWFDNIIIQTKATKSNWMRSRFCQKVDAYWKKLRMFIIVEAGESSCVSASHTAGHTPPNPTHYWYLGSTAVALLENTARTYLRRSAS